MNNKRRDLLKKMTVSQQFVTQAEDNAKMDKVRRYAPLILLVIMTAIGGISQDNIDKLYGSGIDGVAVISAIFGQKDIKKATRELVCKTKKL